MHRLWGALGTVGVISQRGLHAVDGAARLLRTRVGPGTSRRPHTSRGARAPRPMAHGDPDAGHGRRLALLDTCHRWRRARIEQCACRDTSDSRARLPSSCATMGRPMNARSPPSTASFPRSSSPSPASLIMLIDPLLPRAASRKPIGWLALLAASGRLRRQRLAAFARARHRLLRRRADRCLQRLLPPAHLRHRARLAAYRDRLRAPRRARHRASIFALILFGAVGMLLMTSAVELLLVFIGLEISSISTYILAGFRKRSGKSPEAGAQVLPARFVRHGVLPLWHRADLRRYRHHPIAAIAAALPHTTTPMLAWTASA